MIELESTPKSSSALITWGRYPTSTKGSVADKFRIGDLVEIHAYTANHSFNSSPLSRYKIKRTDVREIGIITDVLSIFDESNIMTILYRGANIALVNGKLATFFSSDAILLSRTVVSLKQAVRRIYSGVLKLNLAPIIRETLTIQGKAVYADLAEQSAVMQLQRHNNTRQ